MTKENFKISSTNKLFIGFNDKHNTKKLFINKEKL